MTDKNFVLVLYGLVGVPQGPDLNVPIHWFVFLGGDYPNTDLGRVGSHILLSTQESSLKSV